MLGPCSESLAETAGNCLSGPKLRPAEAQPNFNRTPEEAGSRLGKHHYIPFVKNDIHLEGQGCIFFTN